MTKEEALTLALEALELLCVKCRSNEWGPDTPRKEILNWMHDHASKAHTSIEEALAQLEHDSLKARKSFYLQLDRRVERIRKGMEIKTVTMRCKDYDIALPIIEAHLGHVFVGQVFKPPLPVQEPDYKEALRVLSLALEEAPTNLTPTQRSVWQQSKTVLLSGGGQA